MSDRTNANEDYLREVTVGERAPRNSTIHLALYDPDWPSKYLQLARRIRDVLGEQVLLLEHVGSTSIPAIPAKPVIDIVLAVADPADETSYVPPLEEDGFALRIREPDWYEHRMLKAPDPRCNLHVFPHGCEEVDRMVVFRDWLRADETDRTLYENTQRELAARTWEYTQNYADAKSEVIQAILERALNSSR